MKKILLLLAGILTSAIMFSQELEQIPAGGNWATTRGVINDNTTIISDSLVLLGSRRDSTVGNGTAAPWLDGSADGGTYIRLYGGSGSYWTALQGGVPAANRTWRLPIMAAPSAGLRAFLVVDQYGNMQFKDSADVGGGGVGDVTEEMLTDSLALKAPISNPNFTGTVRLATSDTLATRAYARQYGGTGTVTESDVANQIHDSIVVLFNEGELGIAVADTVNHNPGSYITPTQLDSAVASASVDSLILNSGSINLVGNDYLRLNTSAYTNVTLPVSGTLANLTQVSDSIAAHIADLGDSILYTSIVDAKKDTMEIFCFAAGMGLTADTAGFQTTSDYGGWYHKGRDTLMVTELRTILGNGPGSDTLTIQVWVNDTITTTYAAKLFTTARAIGDSTGTFGLGDVASSFSTTPFKIPPRTHIWMTTPWVSAGNKPTKIRSTLSGYKKNGQY